jgi:acetyl esterase
MKLKILLSVLVVLSALLAYFHFTDPHIDTQIKIIDVVSRVLFRVCGAYPGGNFSRSCVDVINKPTQTYENTPKDGVYTRDITITSAVDSNVTIHGRLFTPSESNGKLPLIIYFHGGGYVIGSCRNFGFDMYLRKFASDTNSIILGVDYRKAPENPYPAAVRDCYSAFKWVEDSIDSEFSSQIDTNRITVMGDSAGATLAHVLVIALRDKILPHKTETGHVKHDPIPEPKLNIAHQLLVYPSPREDTDSALKFKEGYLLNARLREFFSESYTGNAIIDAKDPFFYPLRAHTYHGLPVTTIITATFDALVDGGNMMAEKFKNAGIKVYHREFPSTHGFFSMPIKIGEEARQYAVDVLKKEGLTGK